jgi:hypothetical protein
MPPFRFRTDPKDVPESPEALFRDLRPRDEAVRDLYLRQGDVLRAYHELTPQPRDVALELPTGAGKTLVGYPGLPPPRRPSLSCICPCRSVGSLRAFVNTAPRTLSAWLEWQPSPLAHERILLLAQVRGRGGSRRAECSFLHGAAGG